MDFDVKLNADLSHKNPLFYIPYCTIVSLIVIVAVIIAFEMPLGLLWYLGMNLIFMLLGDNEGSIILFRGSYIFMVFTSQLYMVQVATVVWYIIL